MKDKFTEDKFVVYEYNEKASPSYVGTRFMTSWTEPIEEKPDSHVNIIAQNVSNDEAYQLIDEAKKMELKHLLKTYQKP